MRRQVTRVRCLIMTSAMTPAFLERRFRATAGMDLPD